jgi:hypothetical protein
MILLIYFRRSPLLTRWVKFIVNEGAVSCQLQDNILVWNPDKRWFITEFNIITLSRSGDDLNKQGGPEV